MPPNFEHTPRDEIAEAIDCLARGKPLSRDALGSRPDREWPLWLDVVHAVMQGHHTTPEHHHDTAAVRARATRAAWAFAGQAPVASGTLSYPPLSPSLVAQLVAGRMGIVADGVATRAPSNLEQALCAAAVAEGSLLSPDLTLVQPLVSPIWRSSGFGTCGLLRLWRVPIESWQEARATVLRAPAAALLQIDRHFDTGLVQVQAVLQAALHPDKAFALAWDLKPLEDPTHGVGPAAMQGVEGESATAGLAFGALWVMRHDLRREAEWAEIAATLDDADPAQVAISAGLSVAPDTGVAASPLARWALEPVGGTDDKGAALHPTLGVLPAGTTRPALYLAHGQPGLAVPDASLLAHDLGELVHRIAERTGVLRGKPGWRALRRWLQTAPDNEAPDAALLKGVERETPDGPQGYLLRSYAHHAGGDDAVLGAPVRLAEHFVQLRMRSEDLRPRAPAAPGTEPPREDEWTFDGLPMMLGDPRLHDVKAFSLEAEPFTGKTTVLAQYVMACARKALTAYATAGHWQDVEIAVLLPMSRLAAVLQGRPAIPERLLEWLTVLAPELAAWLPAMVRRDQPRDWPGFKMRLLVDAVNELEVPDEDSRAQVVQAVCDWFAGLPPECFLPPVLSVRAREKPIAFTSTIDRWAARSVVLQAWRPDRMRSYIRARFGADEAAARRLMEELGIDPEAADEALQNLDLDALPLARFCSSPGILAAQCTLQLWRPGMSLPRHRADLLLALLWYSLHRVRTKLKGPLLSREMRSLLKDLDQMQGWWLPAARGRLVDGLIVQAAAMQDAASGMTEDVPLRPALAHLQAIWSAEPGAAETWLEAAVHVGWVQRYMATLPNGQREERLRFTHQQFQELCAALDPQPDQIADLTPPPLDPPDEAALVQRLAADKRFQLELPAANRHRERVRLAAATGDAEVWIRSLLARDLVMAARVAADLRERLEGEHWSSAWKTPHPLLQQIRRLLLLRAVDAGSEVKARVEASRVGELMLKLEHCEGYEQAFGEARQAAFRGGVDIRQRLEAGLLLGELGDTVRLDWKATEVEGKLRRGLVLKQKLWLDVSHYGQPMKHHLGDNPGKENEKEFEIELDPFWLAKLPVTVAEWRAYMEDGDDGPERLPWTWGLDSYANPLQAVSCITWYQAMSYARWAGPLYAKAWGTGFAGWQVALPDETQWEAGVRHPQPAGLPRLRWPYPGGEQKPDALCFNAYDAGWRRPSPVGVWACGWSEGGVAEVAGGQWEWCINRYRHRAWRKEMGKVVMHGEADLDHEAPRVLRGGSFRYGDAQRCRTGFRLHRHPSRRNEVSGLRLVLRRAPPHSGS